MASSVKPGSGLSLDRRDPASPATPAGETTNVSLTTTSWSARSELAVQDWTEQGRQLGTIGRGVGWWISDWVLYGNERFGERYVRAARITGYDPQTLMNMVYVASRFEASRRRERLSFSHHAEVASLDPAAQDYWLARAEAERLSVRCLREEVRRQRKSLAATERVALAPAPAVDPEIVCPECGCRVDGDGEGEGEGEPG